MIVKGYFGRAIHLTRKFYLSSSFGVFHEHIYQAERRLEKYEMWRNETSKTKDTKYVNATILII